MSRSQLKLVGALAALVILVVGVTGWLAERRIQTRETQAIRQVLEEEAALIRALSESIPFEIASVPRLDAIADRAGELTGTRVTLIASDGTVLGDSDVPLERIAAVDNHAGRPEVAAALAGDTRSSVRYSDTVGRSLVYLAVPVAGGSGGVVRLAMDQRSIEAARMELRRELIGAAAIGLVAALVLSYLVAWATLRPLRQIQALSASVAAGELNTPLPHRFGDEFGVIAKAVRQLAEQLRDRLAETTAEKERLQAVLESMSEGVLVVDREGLVTLANDRVHEFFGTPERIVGKTVVEAVRHGGLAELMAQVRRRTEAVHGVIDVSQPAERTLQVHAVPFPAQARDPQGTAAVLHDVTDLRKLEIMRREFVANASHELRTPLAAIRGFTETLLESDELAAEDQRNYLGVIDRHTRRLGNLVDDLLELSRIESGKTELAPDRVDLGALTEQLVRDASARAEQKDITLSCTVEGSCLAWANAAAVEQIVTNVLDNALKYTDTGGRVTVGVESRADGPRIRIEDTGIGIPESDLGRIFERFYRVDKARSRELGGTGLGLAIVKHLLQTMGGDIQVTSEPDKGSVFVFTLPPVPRS